MGNSTAPPPSPEFLAERNNPGLDQRVSIAFIVIDTFFLGVFLVSRYLNPKAIALPMVIFNTLCYLLCLGSAVAGILMVKIGGVGHHVASLPTETFQTWLQLSKVLEFTYTPAVMFSKLAALVLYYRVFEAPNYRRVILGIGVIIILQGVISFILAFTICRPFRYFWTQVTDPDDGTCGDVMLFYKSYSIPSLVTDVAMLVLPWPILLKLHMPLPDKIGLFFTFLAASLGIITSALRFVTFFTVPLFSDPTWYASGGPMIYALVEPSIYMIASILPTTRHLYVRAHRKARSVVHSRNTGSKGSPSQSKAQTESAHSAELAQLEDGKTLNSKASTVGGGGIKRHVDIWQEHTSSSQEELTLGEWYQSQEGWHDSKQTRAEPSTIPHAH